MADGSSHSSYPNIEKLLTYGRRNWTKNNKFWVEFRNNSYKSQKGGQQEVLRFLTHPDSRHEIASSIIDVNLFDVVADPLEQYIDEHYVQSTGRIQSSQISIKFRDYNKAYLYARFHKAFYALQREYIADSRITITLCLDRDWSDEKHRKYAEAYDCVLVSLSGLTFDNASQNQFLEFTATFKTPKIIFEPNQWLANPGVPTLQRIPFLNAEPTAKPKFTEENGNIYEDEETEGEG